MTDNTDTLLAERGKTHGRFDEHASITQQTKELWHLGKKWNELSYCQAETLEMIAHKVGRILSGDPNFKDHWDDIAGYARLVSQELERKGKRDYSKGNAPVRYHTEEFNNPS